MTVPIVANEILLPSKFGASESFGFSVFPPGQQPTGAAPDCRMNSRVKGLTRADDAQEVGAVG